MGQKPSFLSLVCHVEAKVRARTVIRNVVGLNGLDGPVTGRESAQTNAPGGRKIGSAFVDSHVRRFSLRLLEGSYDVWAGRRVWAGIWGESESAALCRC